MTEVIQTLYPIPDANDPICPNCKSRLSTHRIVKVELGLQCPDASTYYPSWMIRSEFYEIVADDADIGRIGKLCDTADTLAHALKEDPGCFLRPISRMEFYREDEEGNDPPCDFKACKHKLSEHEGVGEPCKIPGCPCCEFHPWLAIPKAEHWTPEKAKQDAAITAFDAAIEAVRQMLRENHTDPSDEYELGWLLHHIAPRAVDQSPLDYAAFTIRELVKSLGDRGSTLKMGHGVVQRYRDRLNDRQPPIVVVYRVVFRDSPEHKVFSGLQIAKDTVEKRMPHGAWDLSDAHGHVHYYGPGMNRFRRDQWQAYIVVDDVRYPPEGPGSREDWAKAMLQIDAIMENLTYPGATGFAHLTGLLIRDALMFRENLKKD